MSFSPQEWQRLLARLEYLRLQHATLTDVARVFSRISNLPMTNWISDPTVGEKLEQQHRLIEQNEPAFSRPLIGELGGLLYDCQERLHNFDRQLPVPRVRAYFQGRSVNRDEVSSLLRFLLSNLQLTEEDLDKIDYLTTRYYELHVPLTASAESADSNRLVENYRQMLEYAGISTLIAPDADGMQNLEIFREEFSTVTSLHQLTARETLYRLRRFKQGLKNRRLHPEVMIEMARVNLLAGGCFSKLANIEINRVQQFVQLLKSASITQLEDTEIHTVDQALEAALHQASQLNDDYQHSHERIAQLARIFEILEHTCQKHNLSFNPPPSVAPLPIADDSAPALLMSEEEARALTVETDVIAETTFTPATEEAVNFDFETSALAQGLDEPLFAGELTNEAEESIVPEAEVENIPPLDWWRQALRLRIRQIGVLVRRNSSQLFQDDIELRLSHAVLPLHAWEARAFTQHQPQSPDDNVNVASLLRVSVALMAELREKLNLIDEIIGNQQIPVSSSPGIWHLQKLSAQTLAELHAQQERAARSGLPQLAEQFQHTAQRLYNDCNRFADCFQVEMV